MDTLQPSSLSSAKPVAQLPTEIRIQIFQELWALRYKVGPLNGEELATNTDMYHYFHKRRANFLSYQNALGLASLRKDYPNLLEKEVLDHPIIVKPAGFVKPGMRRKYYNKGWDEPPKITGLHLLPPHCALVPLMDFKVISGPKPDALQGHKYITYVYDTWNHASCSLQPLLSHLRELRLSSLEEANIIYYPGEGLPAINSQCCPREVNGWKNPAVTLRDPSWEKTFLVDTMWEVGGKHEHAMGKNLRKINVEV